MTITSPEDTPGSLGALTERLLASGQAANGDEHAPDEIDDDALIGVGDDTEAMSLREVLREGGPATAVILTLINVVDEFDRIAMAILGPDIQRTFGLNDTGLVALNGVGAVAVFAAGIPLGMLGDRRTRTRLVAFTTSLWAAFALLGGLARNAWQLGLTRIVNGMGKGNGAVVNSILADRYPVEGRTRIYALYGMANPIGNLIGPLLVAAVAAVAGGDEGWRWSLMILSIPAIALAVASFALPEPERGANERAAVGVDDVVGADPIPLAAGFERLRKIRTFSAVMSSLAVLGLAITGAAAILNLLLEREYALGAVGRGVVASITSVGGLVGLAVGARWSDRVFKRDPSQLMRYIAMAFVGLGAVYTLGIHMPHIALLVVFHTAAMALVAAPLAAFSSLIAAIIPFRMRGVGFALMGIYLILVGGLLGGLLVGILSDAAGQRTALTIVFPLGTLGAAAYLASAAKHVRRDMAMIVEELAEEQAELTRIASGDADDELLQVRGLDVSYGPVQVLFDVDLTVAPGETLALLGTNGAGKSTLLRSISGLTLPDRGAIRFEGRTITFTPATERTRRGIIQVAGGNAVFGSLSVRDNLLAGAYTYVWERERLERKADEVLELFPALGPLLDQPAGTLSGGEQQMLGLAKALLLEPRILLIDELSLGLAPIVVEELLRTVATLKAQGLTIVIVEQSINVAMAVADRAVFMEKGRVRFEGSTAELAQRGDLVRAVFLGAEGG